MADIRLNDQEFENVINQMTNCSLDLESLVAKIDTIMKKLETNWKGSAQQAYCEAYDSIKKRVLMPMRDLLSSYPQVLREAKTDTNFADAEKARNILNIYGGIPQITV